MWELVRYEAGLSKRTIDEDASKLSLRDRDGLFFEPLDGNSQNTIVE